MSLLHLLVGVPAGLTIARRKDIAGLQSRKLQITGRSYQ